MGARIQGGSFGRWFEELCRIKIGALREVAAGDGRKLRSGGLPRHGGAYVFWWTGKPAPLQSRGCNRDLVLVGPGGRSVALRIDDDWLGLDTALPIPLYVGKTADSIAKRIGLHLRLSESRAILLGRRGIKDRPPSTSCQLRAGIDHLFPDESDTRSLVLDNVGLSWVELHGDDNAANRFYLEDLAVGLMRPILNVDIER